MSHYTVEIQASDVTGLIWQALHGAETAEGDSAEAVAATVAHDQTIAEGDGWRVCVWDGLDAYLGDGAPAATVYAPQV